MKADAPARLPQVTPEELTDEARKFLGRWTGGVFKDADKNPPLLTFAHHPKLADVFSRFNIHLLTTNTLPVKQRHIAIMRTAWVCKATYMWSSHLNTSLACGLSPDMFAPIQVGADHSYFTEFERSIIRATEDLIADHEVSPANWSALRAEWDHRQMLDFLFTVGCYVLTAGVMRSTGVERQEDLLLLAEKYGEPGE